MWQVILVIMDLYSTRIARRRKMTRFNGYSRIQIQIQEGSLTASDSIMELIIRQHDQRSWRSSSTVRNAVRWSSLRSINSRESPRKTPRLRSKKSVLSTLFSFQFYISCSLYFCALKFLHCTALRSQEQFQVNCCCKPLRG